MKKKTNALKPARIQTYQGYQLRRIGRRTVVFNGDDTELGTFNNPEDAKVWIDWALAGAAALKRRR